MVVQPRQIARVVVLKSQLARPPGPKRMQHDLGAKFSLQLLECPLCVWINRGGGRVGLRSGTSRGEPLDLANRHSAAGDFAREVEAVLGLGNREQRASVA